MIKIKDIAFIGYPVTDLDRAQKFYEGLLGLTPSHRFGEGDQAWIEYTVGTGTFAISNVAPEMWKPSRDGPCLAFEVEDMTATHAALVEAEVPFAIEKYDGPVCLFSIAYDPDGNSVMFHQKKGA